MNNSLIAQHKVRAIAQGIAKQHMRRSEHEREMELPSVVCRMQRLHLGLTKPALAQVVERAAVRWGDHPKFQDFVHALANNSKA